MIRSPRASIHYVQETVRLEHFGLKSAIFTKRLSEEEAADTGPSQLLPRLFELMSGVLGMSLEAFGSCQCRS